MLHSILNFGKVYTHPKIIAVLFLGLASGLPLALTLSTLSVWMTEEGVSKSAIGLFAAVGTPYALKFLWSPIVDNTPIPFLTRFFGRRRGWLFFIQLLLILSIIFLGNTHPNESALNTAFWALMVAIFSATQDIILDAYRVELLEDEQQGAGAATFVFGYRIGMLLSSAGALFLASEVSWFATYAAMASIILIGTVTALITGEPESSKLQEKVTSFTHWIKHSVLDPFIEFMQRPFWWIILLFVLLYKFGDAFAGIMTNPFLLEMGFDKTEIATVVKTYGLFATIIGTFIGGAIASRMPVLRALFLCGVLQMFSNLLFIWLLYADHHTVSLWQFEIPYSTLVLSIVISVENLAGGMGTAAFVAYISQLCNKQFTATQYALLSSLAAVGRTLLSTSSGITVDVLGWASFFIISTAIAIPGLVLLVILDRKLKQKA